MGNENTIDGNVNVRGTLVARALAVTSAFVTNDNVTANAAIDPLKLRHQHTGLLAQLHGQAATAERRAIRLVRGAGRIVSVRACLSVACSGNATINLLKNGTSVLTAALVLNNLNTPFTAVDATVSTDTLVAGDVLEAQVTINAGTGVLGQGLLVTAITHEDA